MKRALAFLFVTTLQVGALQAQPYPVGKVVERLACAGDTTQTYAYYLPSSYTPEKKWPLLFVFDPRRRGAFAAELFRPAAEKYGWIIASSNDTISDGEWAPNAKAVAAMWPDVRTRFSVDAKRIYAAGFSGGAIVAWLLGQQTGELAGVISCGGRIADPGRADKASFAWYGTAGDIDFNFPEQKKTDAALEKSGLPHRLVVFSGPHRWADPELLAEGVEWMELQAMRKSLVARDDSFVGAMYARDENGAAKLLALHDEVNAMRRYAAIAGTFEGLHDVSHDLAEAARLGKSDGVRRALKDEQYWDEYEQSYLAKLARLRREVHERTTPAVAAGLARTLDIAGLQKRGAGATYEATTARRLLENVASYAGFYFMRDFFAQHEWAQAAAFLEVALMVHPDSASAHYNLACAWSHVGDHKRALDALDRAVTMGYADRKAIDSDTDLEAVRQDARYAEIIAKAK